MTDRDDGVTFARQPERHRFAKSAQPACDQRNPVFTIVVGHGFLRPFVICFPANQLTHDGLAIRPMHVDSVIGAPANEFVIADAEAR